MDEGGRVRKALGGAWVRKCLRLLGCVMRHDWRGGGVGCAVLERA